MAAFTADDPTDRAAFDAHWARVLDGVTITMRMIVAIRALKLLFDEVKVRPMHGRAAADNTPSIRVMLKCGFIGDRRERGFANAWREEIEEVVMELR